MARGLGAEATCILDSEVNYITKKLGEIMWWVAPTLIVIWMIIIIYEDVNDPIEKQAHRAIRDCEWHIPRKQNCKIIAVPEEKNDE